MRDPCYAHGMNATTFDAHAAARAMEAAGIERRHADVIAAAMRQAAAADRDALATKADLRAEIAALQARLMGFIAVVGGLVVAAIKLL